MPSAGKKELSLAKSVGELNKLAEIQDKIAKTANPKPWVNSAEKVYKKAEDSGLMGDEENAYVLYMRFFNIMREVSKTKRYQEDKKYYSSLIGKKTKDAIGQAEKLSESLTKRYKMLEEEEKATLEKERKAREIEKNKEADSRNVNGGSSSAYQDIDDLLNGKKTSTQTSADVYKKLNVNHSSVLSPNGRKADEKDASKQSKPLLNTNVSSIDPVVLYTLINDANDVLILDTRSKKEFEASRISSPSCINIPDDLLKTSVTVGSIERKLPQETWEKWIDRGKKKHIVILDESTSFKDVKPDSKIQCLKDAIYLYDTSCTLQSEPVFLEGGYEGWLWHYPSLVTNPTLPQQIIPSQVNLEFTLDSINYPELPSLPEPSRPNPVSNVSSCSQEEMKFNKPSNSQTSLAAGTTPEDPQTTTICAKTSQNVSFEKPSTSGPLPNTVNTSRPQVSEKQVPVAQQFPILPNQEELPSKKVAPNPQPFLNSEVNRVLPNNENRSNSLQLFPEAPVTDSVRGNMTTPMQTLPNQPRSLNQTQRVMPHSNNQSNNATLRPIVFTVVPQPTTNSLNTKYSSTSGTTKPSQVNQIPSSISSSPEVQQNTSIPITSQTPYVVNGKSPSLTPSFTNSPPGLQQPPSIPVIAQTPCMVNGQATVMSQAPPSSTLNAQPSIAQKQGPNIKPVLNNHDVSPVSPTTQPFPSRPAGTSCVPQKPAKSTASSHVPQTFGNSRIGMTHGLPPGWERVLDRKTGRYYFRDHNTKTTHWNLPESLTQSMNKSIMGNNTPTVREVEPKKPSLKRSMSSPNLAKIGNEESKVNSPKSVRPSVNRRTKPLTESQLANLAPSHGGQGKALTGLRNLGNTCYMNSVLQCLIATAPLAKYILSSFYLDDINKTNPLGTGGRIAEELALLGRVAHSGKYRSVSPVDFKRTIGRFASEFGGQKQQDSQEFLLVLLDQFHEDTNRVIKKAYIEEKSNDGLPDTAAARLAWDNHRKRNQSIIVELFQGQFKSTLTCIVCQKKSVTFDAFMSLTLPIPTNASCQIEDCIRLFTTREKVTKDNKWYCPRCKQHREAWKIMEIWKLPPLLIIHFNRFKRDIDGSWLEKRQTNVHFPITNLDLSKFVLGPKKTLRYNLYGVSNHYGSMQSGHYTAFCRNIYDHKWHKFDDSDVSTMSESSVKSSAAYILCYTSMEFDKPDS